MERKEILQIVYVGLMLFVMIICIVVIVTILKNGNSCIEDPIRYYTNFMAKHGNRCICSGKIIF